jgi:hypothetical protein
VIAWLQRQFGLLGDPCKQCMQTVLEHPLRTPVERVLRRLDGAARGAYVTVAEFRYDGRFGGVADGGDPAGQLMDGSDARPDVEAAGLGCGPLHRSEYRVDDDVDKDEIAHDPTVFVDLQRALLARQSREEGDYSGVRIGKRLARSVDILQT